MYGYTLIVLFYYNFLRAGIAMDALLKLFGLNEVNLGIVKYTYKGKKHQW